MADTLENKDFEVTGNDPQGAVVDTANIATFLTFVSDGLYFGVNTDQVIEIINNHTIRSFPMVPDYVRGIINLRGQVIPIIDMRLRVGKMPEEYTSQTCIIVLEVGANIIGIVVDSVAHVVDIDMDNISLIPTENRQELTKYMYAVGDGSVILLLECEALIEEYM